MIGLLKGSVILLKICHLVQPSSSAASSMAVGMVSKKPFAIWKDKPAPPEYTRMSARRIRFPSVSHSALRIKYTAIMDMKPGNSPRIIAIFI